MEACSLDAVTGRETAVTVSLVEAQRPQPDPHQLRPDDLGDGTELRRRLEPPGPQFADVSAAARTVTGTRSGPGADPVSRGRALSAIAWWAPSAGARRHHPRFASISGRGAGELWRDLGAGPASTGSPGPAPRLASGLRQLIPHALGGDDGDRPASSRIAANTSARSVWAELSGEPRRSHHPRAGREAEDTVAGARVRRRRAARSARPACGSMNSNAGRRSASVDREVAPAQVVDEVVEAFRLARGAVMGVGAIRWSPRLSSRRAPPVVPKAPDVGRCSPTRRGSVRSPRDVR